MAFPPTAFDTPSDSEGNSNRSQMPRPKTIHVDFSRYAEKYQVTERTCRNWHSQGADLDDPESVGDLILKQRYSHPHAIATVRENLTENQP